MKLTTKKLKNVLVSNLAVIALAFSLFSCQKDDVQDESLNSFDEPKLEQTDLGLKSAALDCTDIADWDRLTNYKEGDKVNYEGYIFEAKKYYFAFVGRCQKDPITTPTTTNNTTTSSCTVTTPCVTRTYDQNNINASASSSNGDVVITVKNSDGEVIDTINCSNASASVSVSCK